MSPGSFHWRVVLEAKIWTLGMLVTNGVSLLQLTELAGTHVYENLCTHNYLSSIYLLSIYHQSNLSSISTSWETQVHADASNSSPSPWGSLWPPPFAYLHPPTPIGEIWLPSSTIHGIIVEFQCTYTAVSELLSYTPMGITSSTRVYCLCEVSFAFSFSTSGISQVT